MAKESRIDIRKLTYSVVEAAEALGVSKTTMYQLVKSEGFPVIQIGKRMVIPIKSLERWVEGKIGYAIDS